MKVWAAWQDNGQGEADSLIGLYSDKAKAEQALADGGVYGGYTEEIEVE